MPSTRMLRVLAGSVLFLLGAASVQAQLDRSTVRGLVTDEAGQPLAGVTVEMEFKGESHGKVVKKATTDKKGAYIRVGLTPGPYQLVFIKDGFERQGIETYLSGGGISEIATVTLAPAAPAPAAPTAPLPPSPAPDSEDAERAKKLSATYGKAVEALRAGRGEEAEALFKEVLAVSPGLAAVHYNLGYLYAQRGDTAAAEPAYRKAIELQPDALDAYVALSTLLASHQREAEALELLQGASSRFAASAPFHFALGATAFNLARAEEAEAAFLKAVELDPANAEPYFYLGSLSLGKNDVPEAVERLEKYLAGATAGSPNRKPAEALLTTLKKKK